MVDPKPLIERILDDEGITSGLDEREGMLFVETLTEYARRLATGTTDAAQAQATVDTLCRRARKAGRAVEAYRDEGEDAGRERATAAGFHWPEGPTTIESLARSLLDQLDPIGARHPDER